MEVIPQKPNCRYITPKVPIKYDEIRTGLAQKKNKKAGALLSALAYYNPEDQLAEHLVPRNTSPFFFFFFQYTFVV